MTDQVFVTLTTNDAYTKGALVLGSSLKQHRTTRRLVMLATLQVSDSMRKVLETVFDEIIMVDVLDSGDSYSKCVFMGADTLVLANIDDLFETEELSAAPDPGWPDFETYNQLLHLASEQGSFDGGEQGIRNTFFCSWATTDIRKHLPFIYSLSPISHLSLGGIPAMAQSLYPQKNGRSGGNRARPIIWEQILLTTSRGSLTLTSSRNTAFSCGHIHFTSLVSDT
uniref:Glycogenin 1 n=1 Tax=Gorilla gorilla gorilla TaxID=9595 RepID=A0A2I2YS20_GORGO